MKNHLPGYLKDSERTATEEQHLRLDSLNRVYEINEAYISSILNALNPDGPAPAKDTEKKPNRLTLDSLQGASDEEKNFMEYIRERDKYNIGNIAALPSQSMIFDRLNSGAVISEDSKDKYQAELIYPIGKPVSSLAEGRVISVASSPKASGGYEVIILHPKGFVSKISRLTNLMVKPGERISQGQIIAGGTVKDGMKGNRLIFELWQDGDRLIPASYISGVSSEFPK